MYANEYFFSTFLGLQSGFRAFLEIDKFLEGEEAWAPILLEAGGINHFS